MRRIEGAPPIHMRNWQPITEQPRYISSVDGKPLAFAEALYIFKPLIHLGTCARYGLHSWKSYMIAVLLDSARYKWKMVHTHMCV